MNNSNWNNSIKENVYLKKKRGGIDAKEECVCVDVLSQGFLF